MNDPAPFGRFPEHLRIVCSNYGVALTRAEVLHTVRNSRTRGNTKPSVVLKRRYRRERADGESYKAWLRRTA